MESISESLRLITEANGRIERTLKLRGIPIEVFVAINLSMRVIKDEVEELKDAFYVHP